MVVDNFSISQTVIPKSTGSSHWVRASQDRWIRYLKSEYIYSADWRIVKYIGLDTVTK